MSTTMKGTAHLHAQECPHDEAYLITDRAGLLAVRAAIDRAMEDPAGVARADLFAADGEGYALFVLVPRTGELEAAETPYTGVDSLDRRPEAVHPAALLLRRPTTSDPRAPGS